MTTDKEIENMVAQRHYARVYENLDVRYNKLFEAIKTHGWQVDSRYGPTKELMSQQFSFPAGVVLDRAGQNIKVSWVEIVQLIAGIYDPAGFAKYAPNSEQSLFTEGMAYGPRTVGTVAKIIRMLAADPFKRSAYLAIGRPGEEGTPDLPCTLGLQFRVVNEPGTEAALWCNAFMRSLDILKGLPVDVMMFGALTQVIASCLGLRAGQVIITAGSCHYYEADAEGGRVPRSPGKSRSFDMPHFPKHVNYLAWALAQSHWRWTDHPDDITLHGFGAAALA